MTFPSESFKKAFSYPMVSIDTAGVARGHIELECDGVKLRVPNVWLDDLILSLYMKRNTLRQLYPESFDDDLKDFFDETVFGVK